MPPDARAEVAEDARPRARTSLLRWVERILLVLACAALGFSGFVRAQAFFYQRYESRALDRMLDDHPAADLPRPATLELPSRPRPALGAAIGRIEIPRLGLSAVVRNGSDARTLGLAVGHVPGTALPGEPGNVGLAGHRDTFFRGLGEVRTGDEISVTTVDGVYRYRVEQTGLVNPDDVWVLDATDSPALTLVTCYPFNYIGSAPRRFIVRAALLR